MIDYSFGERVISDVEAEAVKSVLTEKTLAVLYTAYATGSNHGDLSFEIYEIERDWGKLLERLTKCMYPNRDRSHAMSDRRKLLKECQEFSRKLEKAAAYLSDRPVV